MLGGVGSIAFVYYLAVVFITAINTNGSNMAQFIEHRRENPVIFSCWDESIELTLFLNVFSGCFGRRVTNSCFRYLTTRIKCRAIKYLQCELV
jgi:hypothetical protein